MFIDIEQKALDFERRMIPFLKQFENELSKKHIKGTILSTPIGYMVPCIFSLPDSQTLTKEEDAFALRPLTAGNIKDVVLKPHEVKMCASRSAIGYAWINQLSKLDDESAFEQLKLILFPSVISLFKEQGFDDKIVTRLGDKRVTVFRPGYEEPRWLFIQRDIAAFEFRLWSNAMPLEKEHLEKYIGRKIDKEKENV